VDLAEQEHLAKETMAVLVLQVLLHMPAAAAEVLVLLVVLPLVLEE
jgi:hypothetical protein